MTYCVGIMLDTGLIFASDSRTHAEVDNFARFCKMTVFERAGDRVLVLLSSGNLAGTQAVISLLKQRNARDGVPNLWSAGSMFDAAMLVSDAMRDVDRRDGQHLKDSDIGFNASFILGGQITGEPPRLFGVEPPRARIEAVRVVDMSSSNTWAEFAGIFLRTREAYIEHERAKVELKALLPEDAKEGIGHGIRARRSKAGAISFDVLESEVARAPIQ